MESLYKQRVSWFFGQEKQNPVRAEFRLTRSEAELGLRNDRESGVRKQISELLWRLSPEFRVFLGRQEMTEGEKG